MYEGKGCGWSNFDVKGFVQVGVMLSRCFLHPKSLDVFKMECDKTCHMYSVGKVKGRGIRAVNTWCSPRNAALVLLRSPAEEDDVVL